jgi:hypothetical protein
MSGPVLGETPAGAPNIPDDSVLQPHANGHLVSTGWRHQNIAEDRLFIHISPLCARGNSCKVFSYNASRQCISNMPGFSPRVTIQEHGWFTDVAMFQQIAGNHPIPHGQSPEEIFKSWRDSLLVFLDTIHGGIGGRWTPIQ